MHQPTSVAHYIFCLKSKSDAMQGCWEKSQKCPLAAEYNQPGALCWSALVNEKQLRRKVFQTCESNSNEIESELFFWEPNNGKKREDDPWLSSLTRWRRKTKLNKPE